MPATRPSPITMFYIFHSICGQMFLQHLLKPAENYPSLQNHKFSMKNIGIKWLLQTTTKLIFILGCMRPHHVIAYQVYTLILNVNQNEHNHIM